ncbi:fluoride efflux transporter CrcB [Gracilibacillus salinarum]|uniref:Fluoride-specific ion channel FluC n=1 Tax=Gracilibacillus salinarum TaxID=2932255 RepID=A0ABY4GSA4_9BACI|nr:fluoride efflux transporter CrcB [Gracilibacillus salinarum]UOQ87283.1 fluoride efflux transporter CrcB [Gracilibacillus salinarum]
MNSLLLATGAAVGAVFRYILGLIFMNKFPSPPFPVAMLTVNLIGSFGLGAFYGIAYHGFPTDAYQDTLYLAVGLGFFGAFTTFSTFSMETIQLYQAKKWGSLTTYVSLSIIGSVLLFSAALWLFN